MTQCHYESEGAAVKDAVGLMARLPRELHGELRELSQAEDRSLNSMLVLLVRLGLEAWKARDARPGLPPHN